ncbi:MAG: LamG-like jellyroll fold domain-containing protein [Anaerolineales bacterium]
MLSVAHSFVIVRRLLLVLIVAAGLTVLAPFTIARAQTGGAITHTTAADFSAGCAVLAGTRVSDASGGEVRQAATLEDYFNGTTVDTTRWITGTTYTWYTVPPVVSSGTVTLDSAWLRSQQNFGGIRPRFFEAYAQQRINGDAAAWPDLGFYREQPPLFYSDGVYPADSALRIFVTRDTNASYVRARDGDQNSPLTDIDIPILDLTQSHLFRIEWDATDTRFYVDGTYQATINGINTLNTWAFLYAQEPSTSSGGRSPMRVDWTRAGQYPTSGVYTSCALDAGQSANWRTLTATMNNLAGTGATFDTRTSTDGVNWSAWSTVSGNTIANPVGRYLQYRANLSTSNVLRSPEVQQVAVSYDPAGGPTPTNTPAPTFTNTPLSPTPTSTRTPTPTATFTATPLPDLIFADGFESGSFSAWSSATTDNGSLSVSPASALIGARGMQANINDNNVIFVTDNTPNSETRYRARFYFDPNSIPMGNSDAHYVLYGLNASSTVVLRMEFGRVSGAYALRAGIRNDASGWTTSNWVTLTDTTHFAEIDWRASTVAGANNGGLTFWVDGTQQANLTGVDNDTRRVDRINLGAVGSIDNGTRGVTFFDAFVSRRNTYIGPDGTPVPTSTFTPTPTFTASPTNTPAPPTATATRTSTSTNTLTIPPTATNSPTPTNTPLPPTATSTPTPTNTLIAPTATSTPTNTPLPPTATNTPLPPTPTNTPSSANYALQFDGVNDVVTTGQVVGTGPLTIEAWVQPAAANATGVLIVGSDDNTGWSLELSNGALTFWVSTTQGWQFVQHPTVLAQNQWTHVAATYNANVIQVFVNGAPATAVNVGTLTQGPWLRFGGLPGYSYFSGALDDVRTSNNVRYTGAFTPPATLIVDGNTLRLWRFTEGAGQTALDSATGAMATLGQSAGAASDDPLWVAR